MRRRAPRVFIGLKEIAGVYTGLQQGLEELGIPTMRVDIDGNPYGYGPATRASTRMGGVSGSSWSEAGSRIERVAARVDRRRTDARGPARVVYGVAHAVVQILRIAYRTALFAAVVTGYDVVVLSNGGSFFRGHDLALLRRLGKRIVVIFTGSDHRPPFLSGKSRNWPTDKIVAETKRIRRFVRLAERHATAIIALSSSAQFHRRPFVHLLAVGIPFAPAEVGQPGPPIFTGTGVRILHCPTDMIGKGTDAVRAIIKTLRAEGLAIDYVELVGRPNREVIAALAECDFAIDELLSDTPLARFATEAAWFGKPAVTAGEYAREITRDLPAPLIPPSTFVVPEEVDAVVRRFATEADYRRRQGQAAMVFVRDQWNPRAVAGRFLMILDGTAPSEWTYDPARLTYVGGWGLGPTEWRRSVKRALGRVDSDSLGLREALIGSINARLGELPSTPGAQSDL